MKHLLSLLVIIVILCTFGQAYAVQKELNGETYELEDDIWYLIEGGWFETIPNALCVMFDPGTSSSIIQSLLSENDCSEYKVLLSSSNQPIYLCDYDGEDHAIDAAESLLEDDDVAYARPDYNPGICSQDQYYSWTEDITEARRFSRSLTNGRYDYTPGNNDQYIDADPRTYNEEWEHIWGDNKGAPWHHTNPSDHDIDALEARAYEDGDPNVIYAIADNGFAMWQGTNDDSCHEDFNMDRLVYAVNYDSLYGRRNSRPPYQLLDWNDHRDTRIWWTDVDTKDHGTACAGVAIANTWNDIGVAGIAGGTDDAGGCSYAFFKRGGQNDVLEAIETAVDIVGASVMSFSAGHGGVGQDAQAMHDYAYANGLLCIVGAGNGQGGSPQFWCGDHWGPPENDSYHYLWAGMSRRQYRDPIADDGRSAFGEIRVHNQTDFNSTWGEKLSCVAPGFNIWVPADPWVARTKYAEDDDWDNMGMWNSADALYGAGTGTSLSAPMVAGVALLIYSRFPDQATANSAGVDFVKEVLLRSCEKIEGDEDVEDEWAAEYEIGWDDPDELYEYDFTGDYGSWDPKVGYGRINAYYAVAPPEDATNLSVIGIEDEGDYIHPRVLWTLSEAPDVEWYYIHTQNFRNGRRTVNTQGNSVNGETNAYDDDSFPILSTNPPTPDFTRTWAIYTVLAEDYSELESEGVTVYFGDYPQFVDNHIDENTTWNEDYYYIMNSIDIEEGVTLTISSNTMVMIDTAVYIDVYGELLVNGSASNEVVFYCVDSTDTWEGIRQKYDAGKYGEITINYSQIENAEVGIHAIDTLNDDNRISHVTFIDCDWGIYQDSTELDVDSCDFTGGVKGIYVNDVIDAAAVSEYHGNTFDEVDIGIHGDNSVVRIYDCDISNTTDEGIYLDDCDNSLISNVTVDSAGSYGIYIKYSNNVTIDSTESTYNDESGLYFYESGGTVYWSDFTDNLKSGVRCNNSSPTISSCIISDNGTHGLICTSSAQPSLYQRNTLEDNAGYQFATTYKYFPVTNNGLNNIFCAGNDSILNYTAASKPHFDYLCTNNYWGGPSIDPYKLFYSYDPGDTILYAYIPFAGSQFSRSAQKRTLSTYDDSLSAAFAHESLREWSDASRIFYWIAVNDSSDFNRSTAILHWLHDDNADSAGWAARLGSLEEIEDDLDEDSELFEPIGDAKARCLVGARRWRDAIRFYTGRMVNAREMTDSLLAEMHIGAIYLNWAGALNRPERPGGRRKAAPDDLAEPERSFDPTEWETLEYQLSKTSTVPGSQDWKPVSRAAYEKRVREILAILDKQAHTDEALALLPTKYELSAPYPNPFNPSVVVPFALPENTKLRLVIFDILGREVVELADRNIQAGYHRVVWDGKNSAGIPVASGVYIVRLESDKFTAVKKAVMIK